jgi:hypothetical protein
MKFEELPEYTTDLKKNLKKCRTLKEERIVFIELYHKMIKITKTKKGPWPILNNPHEMEKIHQVPGQG